MRGHDANYKSNIGSVEGDAHLDLSFRSDFSSDGSELDCFLSLPDIEAMKMCSRSHVTIPKDLFDLQTAALGGVDTHQSFNLVPLGGLAENDIPATSFSSSSSSSSRRSPSMSLR